MIRICLINISKITVVHKDILPYVFIQKIVHNTISGLPLLCKVSHFGSINVTDGPSKSSKLKKKLFQTFCWMPDFIKNIVWHLNHQMEAVCVCVGGGGGETRT